MTLSKLLQSPKATNKSVCRIGRALVGVMSMSMIVALRRLGPTISASVSIDGQEIPVPSCVRA